MTGNSSLFIKSVTISGFKSFKETTTIDTLEPRHNVIVGRNGSGKSNLFSSIRFVLGDGFHSLSKEQRASLLNDDNVISAYCSITLDNSSQTIPSLSDSLVIKRSIGLKKDEYSIDGKPATRSDLSNLLTSAGFVESNPYYIVPQGRIQHLTNAKDHQRLKLLRDIAGTSVYEQKRLDSLKIIHETQAKKLKINELLVGISARMDELEKEKEVLKGFQKCDRDRRSLQYAIYSKDQDEASSQIQEIDIELKKLASSTTSNLDTEAQNLAQEISKIESKITDLKFEHQELLNDRNDVVRSSASLELEIADYGDGDGDFERYKTDLDRIVNGISRKQRDLQVLEDSLVGVLEKEAELKATVDSYKNEQACLYSKQNRLSKFKNKKERDNWLASEIKQVQLNSKSQKQQVDEIDSEISDLQVQINTATNEIETIESKLTAGKQVLSKFESQDKTYRQEKYKLEEERKSLWKTDAQTVKSTMELKEKLANLKRVFDSTLDRNTSLGLSSVYKIAAKLNLTDKVYGELYKLFTVDELYRTAVEVIAGNSLFHVVVDSDDTVSKILNVMNKEKSGRVTFMPINRIHANPITVRMENVRNTIEMLKYDVRFDGPIKQVFGKSVVCKDLDTCDSAARKHNVTAVTFGGDRVGRKGDISGGYHDKRKSRLDAVCNLILATNQLEEETKRLAETQKLLQDCDAKILGVRDNISHLERKRRDVLNERDPLTLARSSLIRKKDLMTDIMSQKITSRAAIDGVYKAFSIQIDAYVAEMETNLVSKLDRAESERLSELSKLITSTTNDLRNIADERVEIEGKKSIGFVELNSNLIRRRDDLEKKLENIGQGGVISKLELASKTKELANLKVRVVEIAERITEIDELVEEENGLLEEKKAEYENTVVLLQEEQLVQSKQTRNLEKYSSKKALLTQKLEECETRIRDLGVIPDEAFEKYSAMSSKSLLDRLHKVNNELKKYGHVNKKAVEQFNNFISQKNSLEKRKEDLDASGEAIEELIVNLDAKKNEAIQRTFKLVSKNFTEVWEKLVPSGKGRLEIIRKDGTIENEDQDVEMDQQDRDDDDDEEESQENEMDKYSGVAIKVTFNNENEQGLLMSQLSGGQKSLVALALIFAIQKCDPAPFYLFDEIDAALDAQYRTTVANMIYELSRDAQFITTTFRPEMLVNADKFYGVTFSDKVSKVQVITRENAQEFVEQEQPV